MGEPVSTAAVFAFLNSCFKFAEYAVKLYGVESENGVFVRLIQQVQLDLGETERLLTVAAVTTKVKGTPEKWRWIRESIARTKASLNEIGKWVERVRGEQVAYGSVSFTTKVKWIFKDHDKLVTRARELNMTHQTLSNVLAFLTPLEDPTTETPEDLPTYDDATSLDDFLSPQQKRRKALYLDSRRRSEKTNAEGAVASELPIPQPTDACSHFSGSSKEPTTAQRSIYQSSSMIDLTQSTTAFNSFPISTTPNTSFGESSLNGEGADPNGPDSFETMPSGRPTSVYHSGIDGNTVAPHFSSSSLELPRPATSSVAPRRSTESFCQNQLPFLSTSARKTSKELSPHQPSVYHSAGSVNPFEPWVDSATLHATASPDEVVEMIGDLPVRPLSAVPRGAPAWRPDSNNTSQEQSLNILSWNFDSTHASEIPVDINAGDFALRNLAPEVPPKIPHDQPAEQIDDAAPSRSEEMPSQSFPTPQASRAYHQHSTPRPTSSSSSCRPNSGSFSMPSTSASGSKISHAANVKRKPTQKWAQARPANYDGKDYGDPVGEYHDPAAFRAAQETESREQSQSPYENQHQNQHQDQHQQRQPHYEPSQRGYPEAEYQAYNFPERQPGPSTLSHQQPLHNQPEAEYQVYTLPEPRPDQLNPPHQPPHDQHEPHYQDYNSPISRQAPSNARHLPPTIDISSPTPDFTQQQHHRSFSLPEVVVPQPLSPEQLETYMSSDGNEAPLEWSTTVGEMRRRNMKARLAMMSRESSG